MSQPELEQHYDSPGPGRDIVGELEEAVRADKRLRFGLYYSLFEWFNPLYNNDEKNNFSTSDFVTAKMLPELTEIVMKYKVGRGHIRPDLT